VVTQDYFSLPISTAEAPPRENKPLWKPNVDESLVVAKKDFLKESSKPEHLRSVKILDVRTESEYLGKSATALSKNAPDMGAVNIPWNEFFDSKGFAEDAMAAKLEMIHIKKDTPIYVISNKGVRSAAVTLALRSIGFTKVANFAGGYQQLVFEGQDTKKKKTPKSL